MLNGGSVVFTEYPPASFTAYLTTAVASVDEANRIDTMMREAKEGGVGSKLLYSLVPAGNRFQYDTAGQGFDQGQYIS